MRNVFRRKWDDYRAVARKRGEFWKSVPAASLAMFYGAIFCLFATLAVLGLMMRTVQLRPLHIVLAVLFSGGYAVLVAYATVRKKHALVPIICVLMVGGFWMLGRLYGNEKELVPPGSGIAAQLDLLGIAGVVTLSVGYSLFLFFSTREGERFFRTHTEIALARELHQALVPAVHMRVGEFELYGASISSGEVGGDLVDVVTQGEDWTAYVADVSGHGVAPGVLMAMFKASVRSRILAGCDGDALLEGVHRTLYPLKTSNMFITAGFLQLRKGHLSLALAGHPSLIVLRRLTGELGEYPPGDLPIGILPEQSFSTVQVDCLPGDVLLLLTDGITEAANKKGDELGVEPVKNILRDNPDVPLPEMFQKIRQLAVNFGKQTDDQTMLLVRRMR